jgi:hypothetical protein
MNLIAIYRHQLTQTSPSTLELDDAFVTDKKGTARFLLR